jgi:UDP-N-acetylmuramate dehydrogenase
VTAPRLADLTTLRVGGAADGIVAVGTTEQLIAAVKVSAELQQPILIVGGGSNLLIADAGFAGTAVVVRSRGIEVTSEVDGVVHVAVEAGEPWDDFVAWTIEHGLSGLESLSGIPGMVGAAPIQNIGAYGHELGTYIKRVEAIHRYTCDQREFDQAACAFGYRTSLFKQRKDVFVITRVHFALSRSPLSAPVAYAELAQRLDVNIGDEIPSELVRHVVLDVRRSKGMVLDESDHDTWSAGSFFTNPVLDSAAAAELPADAPQWPQADGRVKTSAAWLIEHAGFGRGFGAELGDGAARLSSKHVLALTNHSGTATAADLLALAAVLRDGVREAFGITLEPEPVLVGLTL